MRTALFAILLSAAVAQQQVRQITLAELRAMLGQPGAVSSPVGAWQPPQFQPQTSVAQTGGWQAPQQQQFQQTFVPQTQPQTSVQQTQPQSGGGGGVRFGVSSMMTNEAPPGVAYGVQAPANFMEKLFAGTMDLRAPRDGSGNVATPSLGGGGSQGQAVVFRFSDPTADGSFGMAPTGQAPPPRPPMQHQMPPMPQQPMQQAPTQAAPSMGNIRVMQLTPADLASIFGGNLGALMGGGAAPTTQAPPPMTGGGLNLGGGGMNVQQVDASQLQALLASLG